ncbi:DUF7144 family membrane protein [Microbacterium invictum]|uniref:DUF7144 domain-containing protein n=1 Tax=Microbacterium invictum TaxID=515415 RepID=A0AA40SLW5_9MICO|nr:MULTISPECIES: hypothetical protein [Microbacterium]MBB4138592.1 hypothetical protein [Microbacterium invictum]
MSTVKTSGWVGWAVFAGVILIISGAFSLVQGLIGLIGPNEYFVIAGGSLWLLDLTGWAWWNLIIGAFLVLVALALFAGQTWARVVAVILAILSAVGQMIQITAQPWWALIVIAVDILVVYALTVHGHELHNDAPPAVR